MPGVQLFNAIAKTARRATARRLLVMLLVAAGNASVFRLQLQAAELEELRREVRADSPRPASSESNSQPYNGYDSSDEDCSLWDGWGELLFLSLSAPFWGPPVMVGDHYAEKGYFPHYPYENGTPGFMVGEFDSTTTGYSAHLRTRIEYADSFGDLWRIGGRVLFEHTSRFGLDASYNSHRERVSPTTEDELALGDINLVFRFAQSDPLIMRAGLGANWLHDADGTDWGFNFTYGGDLFPIKPWVVSAELDWGTLGHATLFHIRGTVGAQLNRATFYTGYDFLDIGSFQTHGLIAGVEFWF